jgi:hypothetical protein
VHLGGRMEIKTGPGRGPRAILNAPLAEAPEPEEGRSKLRPARNRTKRCACAARAIRCECCLPGFVTGLDFPRSRPTAPLTHSCAKPARFVDPSQEYSYFRPWQGPSFPQKILDEIRIRGTMCSLLEKAEAIAPLRI